MHQTRARVFKRGPQDPRRDAHLAGTLIPGGILNPGPLAEMVTAGASAIVSSSSLSLHDATSLDVRWFGLAVDYSPAATAWVVNQRDVGTNACSFNLTTAFELQFARSENAGATMSSATARALPSEPAANSLQGFRWVWSGSAVDYYQADDPADPDTDWTAVGAQVGSISASMAAGSPIRVAGGEGGNRLNGKHRRVEIHKSGSLASLLDFTILTPGVRSFTDPQGNAWTLGAGASIAAQ